MKRVILFRGKKVTDGKWTYGYYTHDNQISLKSFIHLLNKNSRVEVVHETVGQCTGVNATNGFKTPKTRELIYEGDLVQIDFCDNISIRVDFKGTVTFLEGAWMVDTGTEAMMLWSDAYSWRIIGNLHDVTF